MFAIYRILENSVRLILGNTTKQITKHLLTLLNISTKCIMVFSLIPIFTPNPFMIPKK